MNTITITCNKPKQYYYARDILDISGIEYHQSDNNSPILLYGFETKKDVKKVFKRFGFTKYEIEDNFDKQKEDNLEPEL